MSEKVHHTNAIPGRTIQTLSLQYESRNNVIVRSNFKSDTRYSIKKLFIEIRKSSQWS